MPLLLLKITVVLTLGLAVASLLRRSSAAVRHLVLASSFAALVAVPAAGWLLPSVSIPVPGANAFPVALVEPPVPDDSPAGAGDIVPTAPAPGLPRYPLSSALYLAWTAGAVGWLGSLGIALARLARLRRTAVPWERGQVLMDQVAADAGMHRAVDVARHEALGAPVTGGFGTPMVLLPHDAEFWNEQDLRQAFLHEIEHVHRRDWIVQVTGRALCAVYWFHPLVWIAWRRLRLEAERACDDAVVSRAEGAAYAQQLVTLAQRVTVAEAVPMLSMARRSDLSVRVRALLDATLQRGRAGRRTIIASAAAAGLVVAGLSPLRAAVAAVETADQTPAQEQDPRRPANQPAAATALADDLIESARRGNVRDVSELIAGGADVNAVVPGDGSALIGAARENRIQMVTFLIEQGADVNLAVPGDGNPLIVAAARGARDVVQYLLDRGADVDASVPGDGSALIVAARSGRLPLVTFLIERGADVNLAVRGDGNPLIAASARGAIDVVQYLLDHGADMEAMVPGDENPLINASAGGHLEVVRLLVERGANVNAGVWVENHRQSRDGTWSAFPEYRSPLSMATKNGHRDLVEFLRAHGATN
jgi:ankyrin repeat protein/beta-lactamase regulating signal transducer with metallopeptidase domain